MSTLIYGDFFLEDGSGIPAPVELGTLTLSHLPRDGEFKYHTVVAMVKMGTPEAVLIPSGVWNAFLRSNVTGKAQSVTILVSGDGFDLGAYMKSRLPSSQGGGTTIINNMQSVAWRLPWQSFNSSCNGGRIVRNGAHVTLSVHSPRVYSGTNIYTPPLGFQIGYANGQNSFMSSYGVTPDGTVVGNIANKWDDFIYISFDEKWQEPKDENGNNVSAEWQSVEISWLTSDPMPEEIQKSADTFNQPVQIWPL